MLSALVEVILPVVLVAATGVVMARRFPIDGTTLGKLSLYALTPPLAFRSLLTTSVSAADAGILAVGFVGVTAAAALLAWLAARTMPPATRAGVVASTIIGNNGNFGLPIALLALGQHGLDQAVVIFVYSMILMFTAGPALLGARGGWRGALASVVRLPVIWAMLAGGAMHALGWTLPIGVMRGVDLLADACIPVVLLALGVQLGSMSQWHLTRPVLTASVLRVVALPLLAWDLGLLLGMRGLPLQSLVLACAMPTAVNVFMLAQEYGSDPDTSASTVAITTVASILTLAFVLANLGALA